MPIYDYICASCGRRTEVMHGVHASGPESCAECGGGPMRKALHPPAVHFKGTGWAKKERAAGGARPAADPGAPLEPKPAAEAGASPSSSTPSGAAGAPTDAVPAKPAPAKASEA